MKKNEKLKKIIAIWGKISEYLPPDEYFARTKTRSCELISQFIEQIPSGNSPILEIGSYTGYNVIVLKELGYQIHAIDLPEVVAKASIKKNYDRYHIPFNPYRVSKEEKIPYPDGFFSAILLIEVLEHLTVNPIYLLSEIKRVLKPGGKILLTTPNQLRLRGRIKVFFGKSMNDDPARFVQSFQKQGDTDDSGYHWKLYTAKEIKVLSSATGLLLNNMSYRWVSCPAPHNFMEKIFRVLERTMGIFFPSCRDWLIFWLQKK